MFESWVHGHEIREMARLRLVGDASAKRMALCREIHGLTGRTQRRIPKRLFFGPAASNPHELISFAFSLPGCVVGLAGQFNTVSLQ